MDIFFLKKKKSAHAYCQRPYFSKSFGGKIEIFSTDVTYRNKYLKIFLKNRRMRIVSARIFSKSFGGKIEIFSTDVTYRNKYLKNRFVYYKRVFLFPSLRAGTFKKFNTCYRTPIYWLTWVIWKTKLSYRHQFLKS